MVIDWLLILLNLVFIVLFIRQIVIAIVALWTGYLSDVPFHKTNQRILAKLLDRLNLNSQSLIYELGCGEGSVAIKFVKKFNCQVFAIDKNLTLILVAKIRAWLAGTSHQITFKRADLFKIDVSRADLVYIYMLPEINKILAKKFSAEMKTKAILISWKFPLLDKNFKEIDRVGHKNQFFVYQRV